MKKTIAAAALIFIFMFPMIMPAAEAEKSPLAPLSVLVVIEEYRPLPDNAGNQYQTRAAYALFTPYPLDFGKNFACVDKTGFPRYTVDVYRPNSGESRLFLLTVGQYVKTGFSSVLTVTLQNEENVSLLAADAKTPFRVQVVATPKKEEPQSYLSWLKRRNKPVQEMECRSINSANELNEFLFEPKKGS